MATNLWVFLCPSVIKITEKDRKFTFQAIVKKPNRLARFDDQDHQNRNFYGECNGSKYSLIALALL